jgi:ubiquinone/menaquinone biosynthesis C-methylase UbiE
MSAFDQYAQEYDQWFDNHPQLYQAEVNAIRQLIPSQGQSLEVGVGSGRFATALNISTGVEPSYRMAELAAQRGVAVCQAIGERLPFANHQYDFVLLVTVICFVEDPTLFLREVFRVVKPEGCIILAFIDKDSALGQMYNANKESNPFYWKARFYSVAEVADFVQAAGFSKVAYCQTIFKNFGDEEIIDQVIDGYGQGAFVVLKAFKV